MKIQGKIHLFYLVLGALLTPSINLNAQIPIPPNPGLISGKLRREANGTPFLLATNGMKGRYVNLAPNRIDIEIAGDQSAGAVLGTVRLQRHAEREVEVTFASTTGNELGFRTVGESTGAVRTSFRFNSEVVQLDHQLAQNSQKEAEIASLFTLAGADPTLRELAREAVPFLSASSLRLVLPVAGAEQHYVTDCAVEAADCLVSLIAYGMSMSALYSSCGFTLGAGCVAALLAHPVLGGVVAVYCGRALTSCGITQ